MDVPLGDAPRDTTQTEVKMKKFKKGDKVKIVGNNTNHNMEIGEVHTISRKNGIYFQLGNGQNVTAECIRQAVESLKDLEGDLKDAMAEVTLIKSKMAFMKKNKLKMYDEQEHKIFLAIQELKGKGSDMAKARALKKIIES